MATIDRREFLQLLSVGGAVSASGLQGGCVRAAKPGEGEGGAAGDFFFAQVSDTHWGFKGPPNPEAASTLPQVIERLNALPAQPDFVVFTGDLTHTDGPAILAVAGRSANGIGRRTCPVDPARLTGRSGRRTHL
jgi:hypothetical protein